MRRLFSHRKYQHLNKILVNRSALEHNFRVISQLHKNTQVAPVLKSNAYGHGLELVASVLDKFSPPFFMVDSLYEAYELKKRKIKTPILIMGYTHPDNLKLKRLPFHFAVFDLETARALNEKQRRCPIHIFIDTGMHREGVPLAELTEFLKAIQGMKNLQVVGLATHLADAENPDNQYFTEMQLEKYEEALEIMQSLGLKPEWRHAQASAGALTAKSSSLNLLRTGLALYGINPFEKNAGLLDLKPALTFTSTLAQIKTLDKDEAVGYNCTYKAKKKMKIGLVPAGYYDGVDRRLSNTGVMKINGRPCPILGRVSMNMTVIGLNEVPNVQVGDLVEIYSSVPGSYNSVAVAAQTAGTIPYDLLVHLAESLRRETH